MALFPFRSVHLQPPFGGKKSQLPAVKKTSTPPWWCWWSRFPRTIPSNAWFAGSSTRSVARIPETIDFYVITVPIAVRLCGRIWLFYIILIRMSWSVFQPACFSGSDTIAGWHTISYLFISMNNWIIFVRIQVWKHQLNVWNQRWALMQQGA